MISVTDEVIKLLNDRREIGTAEYGTELLAGKPDGRNRFRDLIEELADALIYAVQIEIEADDLRTVGKIVQIGSESYEVLEYDNGRIILGEIAQ
ncbi:hypothetical protein N9137_01080 [Pseudomonadales bacterium]|nr:hypothetical protein [Pseudomonadales bacterium]